MRPTLTEILQGIENTQNTTILPRIMATGEMDVLVQTSMATSLVLFMKEHLDDLLEAIWRENRACRKMLEELAPEVREAVREADRGDLEERYEQWAETLRALEDEERGPEDYRTPGSLYRENEAVKKAVDGLVKLLAATRPDPSHPSAAAWRRWRERVQGTLRKTIEPYAALSELILEASRW